jgi:hypothetical protein
MDDWQVVTKKKTVKKENPDVAERAIKVPFSRHITEESRKLPYHPDPTLKKLLTSNPRRGELLVNIEFLAHFANNSSQAIVVVIASPYYAETVEVLSAYFPTQFRFISYQPKMFIADALFIVEYGLYNMEEQLIAYESSRPPRAALLNFELPYNVGSTRYLDGERRFLPWNRPSGTLTKLAVMTPEPKYRLYDHVEYEQIMFRFNSCTRTQGYDAEAEKYIWHHAHLTPTVLDRHSKKEVEKK